MKEYTKRVLIVLCVVCIVAVITVILIRNSQISETGPIGEALIGPLACEGKPCSVYCQDQWPLPPIGGTVTGHCQKTQSGCQCDAHCPWGASTVWSKSSGCSASAATLT